MEVRRVELLTPCLQGRCSTNWAIPPSRFNRISSYWNEYCIWCRAIFSHYRSKRHMAKNKCCIHHLFWKFKRTFKIKQNTKFRLLRKEVIQPHLPIRLPCYDFTPIADPTFDIFSHGFGYYRLSWCDGRCVQGPGTYSRQYADLPLLAIPSSYRRVSACNLNWGHFYRFAPPRGIASHCSDHCSTCVAQDIKGMMIWRHPHLPPICHRQSL